MHFRSRLAALLLLPAAVLAQMPPSPAARSEAEAVRVCRAFVRAQLQYVQQDRNGNGIREYAPEFLAADRKRDALARLDPGDSLWQWIERAERRGALERASHGGAPYAGYYFAILTRQGANAPGGVRDYLVGRHLTGGFALLAWPAKYGAPGRHTFLVNQSGRVLQKDLGPDTARLAQKITRYDPDASWAPAGK